MIKILSIFAITLLQSSLSLAQGIGDVSIEPKSPSLNQPFKVTISSKGDTPACGLQINLGDGTTRDIRAEKFPVVVDHTYAKEGNFAIAVNGKLIVRGVRSLFPCAGDAKTLAVGIGTQSGSPVVVKEQVTPQTQAPAQPQAAQPESNDTSNTAVYRYLEPKNVCKFANSPPDLWSYFEKDLRTLLTLKETSTEQAILNLNSPVWQKRYDMGNYKSVADYWKLQKEDFAIFFDYLKKKESGIPCPWEMKPKTAAFIVQFVNGDFHNCKNTGLTDIQCQDSGARDGHYGFLGGVGGIDKFHAGEKIQAAKEKFNASPQGKIDSLKDKYVAMMAVNECHELRKNYVVKYIDSGVYENARTAMKIYENKIKKDVPSINTDKIWQDAVTQYKSSLVGISLDANKINPQNISKDNTGMCLIMANELIESAPKEAPKKNF